MRKIPTIYILGLITITELIVTHSHDTIALFIAYGIYKGIKYAITLLKKLTS